MPPIPSPQLTTITARTTLAPKTVLVTIGKASSIRSIGLKTEGGGTGVAARRPALYRLRGSQRKPQTAGSGAQVTDLSLNEGSEPLEFGHIGPLQGGDRLVGLGRQFGVMQGAQVARRRPHPLGDPVEGAHLRRVQGGEDSVERSRHGARQFIRPGRPRPRYDRFPHRDSVQK